MGSETHRHASRRKFPLQATILKHEFTSVKSRKFNLPLFYETWNHKYCSGHDDDTTMLINATIKVRSTKVSLVPYTKAHVPEYHEWMKDPDIQAATASEPLTLAEEYAMQESWRRDGDKLTFIVVKPTLGKERGQGWEGGEEEAIGDVNMFISTRDEDEEGHDGGGEKRVVGELELMIARKAKQGRGYGRAAISLFMVYIISHQKEILEEYARFHDDVNETTVRSDVTRRAKESLDYFSVKIGVANARSIKLFEGLGFEKVSEEANYFGEFELRLSTEWMSVEKMREKYAIESYEEMKYESEEY